MKIFSMLFTVLFFLGFVNTSYAENEYTITNTSDGIVSVESNNPNNGALFFSVLLLSDECIRLSESQFSNLKIYIQPHVDRDWSKSKLHGYACGIEIECEPNNYEIYNTPFWPSFMSDDDYRIKIVDQANTSGSCKTR